jgi:hypothetical protein
MTSLQKYFTEYKCYVLFLAIIFMSSFCYDLS